MTPNSFDLSHSRVIAASMHPCCDFVRTSYCTSLLAAESEVRSQEGRQTEMDHRTACQLLILCHFRQFALERERVYQQDLRATWRKLQVCLARRNDGSDSANFEFSTCGVTGALENFETVASKAWLRRSETTVDSPGAQRNTGGSSSGRKLIWMGEIRPSAFQWWRAEVHEHILRDLQITTRRQQRCRESIKHRTKWQLL